MIKIYTLALLFLVVAFTDSLPSHILSEKRNITKRDAEIPVINKDTRATGFDDNILIDPRYVKARQLDALFQNPPSYNLDGITNKLSNVIQTMIAVPMDCVHQLSSVFTKVVTDFGMIKLIPNFGTGGRSFIAEVSANQIINAALKEIDAIDPEHKEELRKIFKEFLLENGLVDNIEYSDGERFTIGFGVKAKAEAALQAMIGICPICAQGLTSALGQFELNIGMTAGKRFPEPEDAGADVDINGEFIKTLHEIESLDPDHKEELANVFTNFVKDAELVENADELAKERYTIGFGVKAKAEAALQAMIGICPICAQGLTSALGQFELNIGMTAGKRFPEPKDAGADVDINGEFIKTLHEIESLDPDHKEELANVFTNFVKDAELVENADELAKERYTIGFDVKAKADAALQAMIGICPICAQGLTSALAHFELGIGMTAGKRFPEPEDAGAGVDINGEFIKTLHEIESLDPDHKEELANVFTSFVKDAELIENADELAKERSTIPLK